MKRKRSKLNIVNNKVHKHSHNSGPTPTMTPTIICTSTRIPRNIDQGETSISSSFSTPTTHSSNNSESIPIKNKSIR